MGSQTPPVEPQNQNVPPVQNKKLTTGLSLLVIALLALVGYLLFGNKTVAPEKVEDSKQVNDQIQPTENQVAGWKTYNNARANFEVRYPSELAIKAGKSISGGETVQFSSGKSDVAEILVNVEGGTLSDVYSSLENALDGMRGVNKFSSNVNQEVGTISVNGVTGFKFRTLMANNSSEIAWETVVFGKNGLIYIITFQKQILEVSDEFLSSFKFTTQAETSDWKTYRNTEYGFEFKYLASWAFENYDPKGESDSKTNLVWVNFSENDQMVLSVEVLTKPDNYLKQNSTQTGSVDFGSNNQKVSAYLKTFNPDSQYECYGVNNLRGACKDQVSVMVSNSDRWLVITGLLENKKITNEFSQILSTFKFTN